MIKESINEMIKQIIDTCIPWVKPGEDDLLRFIDPLDGVEISAHYGATHAAVAFIMYGERTGDKELTEIGYRLLVSILQRWSTSMNLLGFHNDFNNFAICIAWDFFAKNHKQEELAEQIKKIVLSTPDSNNPTVNWFPMRWYVNLKRYQWTGEEKYRAVCNKCRVDIKSATYKDGFIDDRLPIGLSFNLQYDVATVAVMQFLRSAGEDIDISVELGALLNVVAPDGDINYLGRGTNQIFAWGLWVYLLASSGKEHETQVALEYLKDKVPVMLKNNNIMLNEWPGEEKYMWWDYHYCSVYSAHFLFWLVIALEQADLYPVEGKVIASGDSGVQVYKDIDYFVVTFAGRKEYLAEKGPCVATLWTKSAGMVVKGTFGPWQGAFGNKYSPIEATIRNNCGLYKVEQNRDFYKNRYLHKALPNLETQASEKIIPLLADVRVHVDNNDVCIVWNANEDEKKMLSVPYLGMKEISAFVDGKVIRLYSPIMIRNQYSWVSLYQTKTMHGRNWELRIKR